MNPEKLLADFRFAINSLRMDKQPLPALVAMHVDTRMFLIVLSANTWPGRSGLTCDRDGRYHLDEIPIHIHRAIPVGSFQLFTEFGWAKWVAQKGAD